LSHVLSPEGKSWKGLLLRTQLLQSTTAPWESLSHSLDDFTYTRTTLSLKSFEGLEVQLRKYRAFA
jgi:hypothetical protein